MHDDGEMRGADERVKRTRRAARYKINGKCIFIRMELAREREYKKAYRMKQRTGEIRKTFFIPPRSKCLTPFLWFQHIFMSEGKCLHSSLEHWEWSAWEHQIEGLKVEISLIFWSWFCLQTSQSFVQTFYQQQQCKNSFFFQFNWKQNVHIGI